MIPFFGAKKSSTPLLGAAPGQSMSSLVRQQVQKVFTSANPWKAQFAQTLVCSNNDDNVPVETNLTKKKAQEAFTFIISQSRGGQKAMGQDSMAIAKHKDWEVTVLSDGHDDQGHFISQGVCAVLPNVILRMIHERFPDELNDSISNELLFDAFDECEHVVCWAPGEPSPGAYVRIGGGEYEGVSGYLTGYDENNSPIVTIVEEEEEDLNADVDFHYLELIVEPSDVLVPRFNGGGTCVSVIRNVKSNECKLAVAGDSRCMIYLRPDQRFKTVGSNKKLAIEDPCLLPTYGSKFSKKSNQPYFAFLTPQHNVANQDELRRLNEEYPNSFRIQGNFLINPDTDFMIQPTRGFGDHDMHGTGYTHIPQLSGSFVLPEGALLLVASDGVFDENVWSDREIVNRIGELFEDDEISANEIAKKIYEETLDRSLVSGYVDDISIVAFKAPPASVVITEEVDKNGVSKRKSTSIRRASMILETDIDLADIDDEPVKMTQDLDFVRKTSSKSVQLNSMHLKSKDESNHLLGPGARKTSGDANEAKRRQTLKRGANLPKFIETILEASVSLDDLEHLDSEELRHSEAPLEKEPRIRNFEPHPPSFPNPHSVQKVEPKVKQKKGRKDKRKTGKMKKEGKAKVKKGGKTFFKRIAGRSQNASKQKKAPKV